MLIDLPIEEIKDYLNTYSKFEFKVNEAAELLDKMWETFWFIRKAIETITLIIINL